MFKFRYYCVLLRGEWRLYFGDEENKYNVYSFLNKYKIRFKSFQTPTNAYKYMESNLPCRYGCTHISNITTAIPFSKLISRDKSFLGDYYNATYDAFYRYVKRTYPDVTP